MPSVDLYASKVLLQFFVCIISLKQAEAEVVPSSILVKIKVEVGVEVQVEVGVEVQLRCNLDAIQMQLRGNLVEVEVVLSLKTTFSVGVGGWVGGWLEKTGLRLSHIQS